MYEERSIVDAIIAGAKNSKYGRDSEHPEQPGSLTNFFTNVCDAHPAAYLKLLRKLIQPDIDPMPQYEASQHSETLQ